MKRLFIIPLLTLLVCLPSVAQEALDRQMQKLIISTVSIYRHYVDTVNSEKLVEDAIRGMLEKLDPHSSYSTPEQTRRLNEPLMGSFDGIGIQFNILEDTIMVMQTITGGPSEKAGLMPGDRILSANDTAIAGVKMPQEEIVRRLRGPRHSKVRLGVVRDGVDGLFYVDVIRDKIPIRSVDAALMITPRTGIVRFSNFSLTTHEELMGAIDSLKALGMDNLILDLTQNGGGLLQAAADIASEFLPKGEMVVYTKSRTYPSQSFKSRGGNALPGGRLMILIDEYSASAAEILAGAIQDQDRGYVVGRRSFGKGLVQRPFELPDGSMIRLTISKYYTPSGRCIQKPYEKGEAKEYRKDVLNRLAHGELTNADSIHFPDSLKYSTLRLGRTVYGGGGIMPDFFVPLDTTKLTSLYRQISAHRILITESMRYLTKNRTRLKEKFPSFVEYRRNFRVPRSLIGKILSEARNVLGKSYAEDEEAKTSDLLNSMLRALVARDLYGENEYFAVIYEDDDIVNRAVEIMESSDPWPF